MLSILIPTYNYNIAPLVKEIHDQALSLKLQFEILAYDDASTSSFNSENSSINSLSHCFFKKLPVNIGRSAIRNLLAKNAKYENLLFIDAGTFPKRKDFIKRYLNTKNKNVIVGGMIPQEDTPKKPYKLRWLYTKKRESIRKSKSNKVMCSSNFLVNKKVFLLNPFDESIKKYGCEDVLFFKNISIKNIPISQIQNPVIHYPEDDANTFIKKTEEAIENLISLIEENKLNNNSYGISIIYSKLSVIKVTSLIAFIFKQSIPLFKLNFNSSYPSLLLYDFYRLGYFCLLKTKKQ